MSLESGNFCELFVYLFQLTLLCFLRESFALLLFSSSSLRLLDMGLVSGLNERDLVFYVECEL